MWTNSHQSIIQSQTLSADLAEELIKKFPPLSKKPDVRNYWEMQCELQELFNAWCMCNDVHEQYNNG